jgi:hypothetical protein
MSYDRDSISRFCSATGKPYSFALTYCSICKSGIEIIDLDSLPPPDSKSICTTQPVRTLVAATERDNVNARIRNASSRPHAGANALSARNPRTTQQLFSFSVILVLEEFSYSTLEDEAAKLQTVIRRKVHGMFIISISGLHRTTCSNSEKVLFPPKSLIIYSNLSITSLRLIFAL